MRSRRKRSGTARLLPVTMALCTGLVTALSVGAPRPAGMEAAALEPEIAESEMRAHIERYTADRGSLDRYFAVEAARRGGAEQNPSERLAGRMSPAYQTRMRRFQEEWRRALDALDFDRMGQTGRIDYLLLANYLRQEMKRLDFQAKASAEAEPLLPFAPVIQELEDARRRKESANPRQAAGTLNNLKKHVEEVRRKLEEQVQAAKGAEDRVAVAGIKRSVANRAALSTDGLRATLKRWYGFHHGYDPLFTWWAEKPYQALEKELESYSKFLREKLVGVTAENPHRIVGDPVGREALMSELAYEMIPYTPEDLIAVGEREMAWCESEMKRASREMGYGNDWHKALEAVKQMHVEPGEQPEVIRKLAFEAVEYLKERDLISIPDLAVEIWRMEMMSPERQLINPFFTGGEIIRISYPTDTMEEDDKLMSMRGNNIPFSRATVHHELIPGHHLQGFMTERYRPYRRLFRTPFWGEGWALYWELRLWDLGFPRTPAERVGMLFWRMHRCARIIFSLSFHLEKMTPEECVNFLVDRVGHERANAEAEVRRSFDGSAPPLYQAAYLLGGLQIRELHRELVESGKMTEREFHDAVLKENSIPVEMLRAELTRQMLTHDFRSSWRFYDLERARAAVAGSPQPSRGRNALRWGAGGGN